MSRNSMVLAIAIVLVAVGVMTVADAAPPVIWNMHAQQRAGTALVDITYDVEDTDSDSVRISVEMSDDGGGTFDVSAETFSGDIGWMTLGSGKSIVWDAGADVLGTYTDSCRVKVVARDSGPRREIVVSLPNGAAMDMVWIPGGTFTMGSPDTESGRLADEGPQHEVTITQGFYLAKYELTQGQWESVMGTRPWEGQSNVQDSTHYPVVHISWGDMQTFIDSLNAVEESTVYRLPTEAEWEYAARGGTTTRWSFGDDESRLGDYSWYTVNTCDLGECYARGVGTKLPNPWGLYDMHGNVHEWVQDWYGPYTSEAQVDPGGPEFGSDRVVRGGDFDYSAPGVRSAFRMKVLQSLRDFRFGVRLVRQAPPDTLTMDLPGGATMEMVYIEPGTFTMGTTEDQEQLIRNKGLWENWMADEQPAHQVTITRGFYLSKYELTQKKWEMVMGTRPWEGMDYTQDNLNNAASYVSWNDAQAFIDSLNAEEGFGVYRLPTEAEWEYACRAGTPTLWSFGDDGAQLGQYAWYHDNAWGIGDQYAHEVGLLLPNPWGLYDIHGNLEEWVQDWYGSYLSSPQIDPTGPPTSPYRVVRGGGHHDGIRVQRSANRYPRPPHTRIYNVGIRLLREAGIAVSDLFAVDMQSFLPMIASISPASGPTAGGTSVIITGSNFGSTRGMGSATFGGTEAISYSSWSDGRIVCVAPAHIVGVVDVVVTGDDGFNGAKAAGYRYIRPSGTYDWGPDTDLSDVSASFWGEYAGDNAGRVSSAGDVNGDGYDDFLIGASHSSSHVGKVYLILGRESDWSLDTDLSQADASFLGENPGDYAGDSVSGAGDVNGDGYDDFLVGAYGNTDGGGYRAGKAYLILGRAEADWGLDYSLSQADASFIGETAGDVAGDEVSFAGDVNGDGYDDFLIGASYNGEGEEGAGQVYLILGKASGWSRNTDLSAADASFWGENAADGAGYAAVSGAGDVNGDGYDDFLIGAFSNSEGGTDAGQVYLILGKVSGWNTDISLSQADGSFIGENPNDWAGFSVSGAGDVNGDGYDDFLIGAFKNNEGGNEAGQAYLILGETAADWGMDYSLSQADVSFIGENGGDWVGRPVSDARDVNNDGYDDFLIGAYPNNDGGSGAGKAYLILGMVSGWSMDMSVSLADASFIGEEGLDHAGQFLSSAGDVNKDGYNDLLIGANGSDEGGTDAGQVYLVLSGSGPPPLRVPSEYATIQAAIDAAADGDTVLVADGIYTGEGNQEIDFASKAIVVTSENGPEVTIIDCQLQERAFHFQNGEDSTSVLDGFTIRNGRPSGTGYGGAIFCHSSSPTLTNLVLSNNQTGWGGAICCWVGAPTIKNVVISSNTASEGGGAICCFSASPVFINVTVSNNSTSGNGGGIYCESSPPTSSEPAFVNAILWGNSPQEIYLSAEGIGSNIAISYSDVQGGQAGIVTTNNGTVDWGAGNINEDPLFVDPDNGDYNLQSESPCIDAGDPSSPLDPDGTRADMGALYFEQPGRVSGQVTYGDKDTPVPDAQVTLNHVSGILAADETDGIGTYTLATSLIQDSVWVIPSCTRVDANVRAAIGIIDAIFTLRHILGLDTLTLLQQMAADVDGGGVAVSDVIHILDYTLDVQGLPFPVGKVWAFEPPGRGYSSLTADLVGQDYTAIIVGDVDGNYGTGVVPKGLARGDGELVVASVHLGQRRNEGGYVVVSVEMETLHSVYGGRMELSYPGEMLRVVEARVSEGAQVVWTGDGSRSVRVAIVSATPLVSESDGLVEVVFALRGDSPVDGMGIDLVSAELYDLRGRMSVVLGDGGREALPVQTSLKQNSPNPFNPQTTISYDVARSGLVRLSIYGLTGQRIRVLVDGERSSGRYSVVWDGRDEAGRDVASGIYICRMATGDYRVARKMVLVR